MELFREQHTTTDAAFIYVSMDTAEGAGCVGHWIWECALFLPYIKDLQKQTEKPLKILLNQKRRYKTNILSDFGFYEDDIIYSSQMAKGGDQWQEQYVVPNEDKYIMYVPKFFYPWNTYIHTDIFFIAIERFRQFYISALPPIAQDTPITYVARSRVENYARSARAFINMDEFCNLIDKKGIETLHVDTLSSLTPQFKAILSSKTIILERGSVFTINAAIIARNSHIIILNDFYETDSTDPHMKVLQKLMYLHNNTFHIFSRGSSTNPFNVDIPEFEKCIDSIL